MQHLNVLKLSLIWVFLVGVVIVSQADIEVSASTQWCRGRAVQQVNAQTNSGIPQWVTDRQQYETAYTYELLEQPMHTALKTPQWMIDRQQYETTYDPSPKETSCQL